MNGHKITLEEAADFLDCSVETVQELLRSGSLPGIKPGKAWVIPRIAFYEAVNQEAREQASRRRHPF